MRDEPYAQDEYDGYIERVFELLALGGTDAEIVDYLVWVAGRMGMDGSPQIMPMSKLRLRAIEWPAA